MRQKAWYGKMRGLNNFRVSAAMLEMSIVGDKHRGRQLVTRWSVDLETKYQASFRIFYGSRETPFEVVSG